MLLEENILCLMTEALKILTTQDETFESSFGLTFNRSNWFKHILIDSIFAVMIEQRISLPIIFHGWWSKSTQKLSNQNQRHQDSLKIIEIILDSLLKSNQDTSTFLKLSLDYIHCLNQTNRFAYPYLDIQDTIPLNHSLVEQISYQLRVKN